MYIYLLELEINYCKYIGVGLRSIGIIEWGNWDIYIYIYITYI